MTDKTKQAEPQRIICNHYHDDEIKNITQYIQGRVVYVSDASNPTEGDTGHVVILEKRL